LAFKLTKKVLKAYFSQESMGLLWQAGMDGLSGESESFLGHLQSGATSFSQLDILSHALKKLLLLNP
jgi:hypothetical protein